MKVLFWTSVPFSLAHGGVQTYIEGLLKHLPAQGVEAEPLRWWDPTQTGDVLHTIGRTELAMLRLAQKKGMKVVFSDLLDSVASRSDFKLALQRASIKASKTLLGGLTARLNWESYVEADALIFFLRREQEVAQYLFGAPDGRCSIIRHGLEQAALDELGQKAPEGDHLVSAATITPHKNTVALATAARDSKVPIVFLGKPFGPEDPYFKQFQALVDGKYVRYAGYVSQEEKVRLLRTARGFALLSYWETGCIAVYEAAAAGLPLLLSDLPWARQGYTEAKTGIAYAKPSEQSAITAALAEFYPKSHRLPHHTFPVQSLASIAEQHAAVYRRIVGAKIPS